MKLRRVMRGVFAFVLAVVLVAGGGCAATTGDGDVVDDWSAMPSASVRVPPTGACYLTSGRARDVRTPLFYQPVVCSDVHGAETFHVGQFPDTVAVVPASGSGDFWTAFDECEKQSQTFLGGDWFNARLYLTVFVPTKDQWDAGARWYTCQFTETTHVASSDVAQRAGSLRGAMTGAAAIAHRCTDVVGLTEKSWDEMINIDCAQPHDAEYAGSFKVPGTALPAGSDQRRSAFNTCKVVIAGYLGGTVDGIRAGYIAAGLDQEDWQRGDRYVRCFAWSDTRKTTGSMKGIGNRSPA